MSRKAEAMRMRGLLEKYHQSQISLSQFAADHGVTRSQAKQKITIETLKSGLSQVTGPR